MGDGNLWEKRGLPTGFVYVSAHARRRCTLCCSSYNLVNSFCVLAQHSNDVLNSLTCGWNATATLLQKAHEHRVSALLSGSVLQELSEKTCSRRVIDLCKSEA